MKTSTIALSAACSGFYQPSISFAYRTAVSSASGSTTHAAQISTLDSKPEITVAQSTRVKIDLSCARALRDAGARHPVRWLLPAHDAGSQRGSVPLGTFLRLLGAALLALTTLVLVFGLAAFHA